MRFKGFGSHISVKIKNIKVEYIIILYLKKININQNVKN